MSERPKTLPKLLIVEDDLGLQRQLRWAYDGYEVIVASDRESAIDALRQHEPAVVTLDLGLPPDPDGTTEGFATLTEILALKPDTKVIVASGHGARESALRAIADGAWDFYQKPIDIDALGLIVARAFHVHALEAENRRLAAASTAAAAMAGLISAAPEMLKVTRTIERVAPADVSVMLLGASGTGKELLARGVHDASPRHAGAFVAINCAAIPETLLESELFGHEPGAFTGAQKRRMAAPCFSTRSATCRWRCRSNCCASCRSGRSSGSAGGARSRSTRGSSAPRIAISTQWWRRAASARISITGSTRCR